MATIAEDLGRIIADAMRRGESECLTCRARMLRPRRRRNGWPLWTCPTCLAGFERAGSGRELVETCK